MADEAGPSDGTGDQAAQVEEKKVGEVWTY